MLWSRSGQVMPALRVAVVASLLSACVNANEVALRVGAPPVNAPELRTMQISRFETVDESLLMSEATQVLQDLGFAISESAPQMGVLAGFKARDATEAGQIAAQVALTIVAAAFLVAYVPTWDTEQVIRVTLTSQPLNDVRQTQLRASFERIVTTNQGQIRVEPLLEPEMHSEFFKLLGAGMMTRAGRT